MSRHRGNMFHDRRRLVTLDESSSPIIGGTSPVNIIPHPSRADVGTFMMDAEIVTRDLDAKYGTKPVVRYIGSDMSEDRYGTVLDVRGWQMEAYRKNPVVCWAHQYGIPVIGSTRDLQTRGSSWEFDVEFAVEEWNVPNTSNLAQLVYNLVRSNKMSGCSVGFLPKKWELREATSVNPALFQGKFFQAQELVELSATPVPSNRNSLKKAIADGEVSENALAALGLDFFMRNDGIIQIRSFQTPDHPIHVRDLTSVLSGAHHLEGKGKSPDASTRGGMDGGAMLMPSSPSTPNSPAAELPFIVASIDIEWREANRKIAMFPTASSYALRSYCQYGVSDALNNVTRLRDLLRDDHKTDHTPGATSETRMVDGVELRDIESITHWLAENPIVETRVGKRISKATRAELEAAIKAIQSLLDPEQVDEVEERSVEVVDDPVLPRLDVVSLRQHYGSSLRTGRVEETKVSDSSGSGDSGDDGASSQPKFSETVRSFMSGYKIR